MISPTDLYSTLAAIVASVLHDEDSEEQLEGAALREALVEFADLHELDVQQTATLFRIASGEGHLSPVYRVVFDGEQR